MKKKFFYIFMFFLLCQNILNAHSVLLNIFDNEDGTMEISGIFSTGEIAAGSRLTIISQGNSNTLFKGVIPDSGTLIVKVPSVPYKVILDSGPGHKVEMVGEVIPMQGFKEEIFSPSFNIPFIVTFSLSMLFILLGIILAIKNSRKISLNSIN